MSSGLMKRKIQTNPLDSLRMFSWSSFQPDKETWTTMFGEITIEIVWDLNQEREQNIRNEKTIKDFGVSNQLH